MSSWKQNLRVLLSMPPASYLRSGSQIQHCGGVLWVFLLYFWECVQGTYLGSHWRRPRLWVWHGSLTVLSTGLHGFIYTSKVVPTCVRMW